MELTIFFLLLLTTMIYIKNSVQVYFLSLFSQDALVPLWSNTLVYFADNDSGEKTEDPTPRKIRESRKKGQVIKSNDLNAAIILTVSAILMALIAENSFKDICKFLYINLSEMVSITTLDNNYQYIFTKYILSFFEIVGITFVVIMFMGIVANLIQSGFVFSIDPLKPNLKKLNPVEGFKNLFSKRAVFNFFKTIIKFLMIGVVAYIYIRDNIDKIFYVAGMSIQGLFPYIKELIFHLVIRVVGVMIVLGVVDYLFQRYDYKKRLRMTKHEVKEEWKQMEGDPQLRSMRKQKQRQISMNRMMAEVSHATVVVTNPTHLAIALKYDMDEDEVPVLVGKGADYVAQKIREVAKKEDIPIIENKPLAQVLYKKVELGDAVPPALYQAVAEILAVVYKMKKIS